MEVTSSPLSENFPDDGSHQTCDDIDHGRFAGSVRADDAYDFAAPGDQADVAESFETAEGDIDPLCFEDRRLNRFKLGKRVRFGFGFGCLSFAPGSRNAENVNGAIRRIPNRRAARRAEGS